MKKFKFCKCFGRMGYDTFVHKEGVVVTCLDCKRQYRAYWEYWIKKTLKNILGKK